MTKYQHRDRIAKSISWGHWFTFANIILALIIGTLYLESADFAGSPLAIIYLAVSWLGHFAFLPFVIFIVLLFPFCLLFPYSRFLRGLGAIIGAFGLFILLLDAIFFRQYGFHLNTYALAQLASDAEQWFTGGSFVMLIASIVAFLAIFAIQLLLANVCWKRLDLFQSFRTMRPVPGIFVGAFLISHSMHIWADATLFTPITQQDDLFPLSYPTTAKTLMTRHGWIDISTLDTQRDAIISAERISLRYPINPLLCARESQPAATLIIVFEELSHQHAELIDQRLPELNRFGGYVLGHPDLSSANFQAVYGIPDRYMSTINHGRVAPAYLSALTDFGYPMHWFHTTNWSTETAPTAIQSRLQYWSDEPRTAGSISMLFAHPRDLEAVVSQLRSFSAHNNMRIIVTAGQPSPDNGIKDGATLVERLNVPLWTRNISVYPERQLAKLNDLMPTVLNSYMSCAERTRSFSNGISLTSRASGYPRVASINPRIYLFEREQTSVLTLSGDAEVYDAEGQLIPGAQPNTAILIQGLNELQRFSWPRERR
ncbi:MAG: DUF3413 domain-containing protein [Idiomarina sp.]|nr:DUF3413 domain-containing protein [Idiomarina sp.]